MDLEPSLSGGSIVKLSGFAIVAISVCGFSPRYLNAVDPRGALPANPGPS